MEIIETHTVPAIDAKIRLQEYAVSIFNTIPSKSGIKKAIKRGEILLNGAPANTSDWIEEGFTLELLKPEQSTQKSFDLKLRVIYEDEFLALVNKPAGYPTSGNYFKTIENALSFNLETSNQLDALPRPLPAHRLDNPTSGILLCAKTRIALTSLQKGFSDKTIQKVYLAMVKGKFESHANYNQPIEGKEASTIVSKLSHCSLGREDYSIVKAHPETGRTHQIRIHLSHNGFPIVGDPLYGNPDENFKKNSLFLTAIGIRFQHPIHMETMQFEIVPPKKFRKFIGCNPQT